MKKKIIVLQGLPASGKSTWAKSWVSEDSKGRVRFNRDDVRNMLGVYWVPSREHLINSMYSEFLQQTMLAGYDIVIDNMNLNKSTLKEIEQEVSEFNEWIKLSAVDLQYEIEYKEFFGVPLETLIERDATRSHPVGEKCIRDLYTKYKTSYPL